MADCPDRVMLERLVDHALTASEQQDLRAHLEQCTCCRSVHEEILEDHEFVVRIRGALTRSVDGLSSAQNAHGSDTNRFPRIEGYRIVELIGRGGMGVVYKAIQENLDREVALKVLPPVIGVSSATAVARFRREAAAAARLHHTNIVPVHDFGQSDDGYYYAMEFIEGDSLNKWIHYFAEHRNTLHPIAHDGGSGTHRSGPAIPVRACEASEPGSSILKDTRRYYRQVARWIADVADGLDYAHAQGIIHRDVKPSNLILSSNGRLMITDFGLAKSAGEASVTLTGSLIGTVSYLSPEQAMAKRIPVDHRTDVYSLGATMYELLCFERAFKGKQENEILAAVISKDPVPPRRILSVVPQELDTICLKTLEKSPDARYQSAYELSQDLRRFVDDLPISAKRPNPLQRGLKFVRRHKAGSLAFVVVILLGLSLGLLRSEQRIRALAEVSRHVERGKAFHERGLWERAEVEFHRAIALRDSDYVALGNLARLHKEWFNEDHDRHRLDAAREYADKALEFAPKNQSAGVWNLKGVVLKKLGDLDGAITAYAAAIDIHPGYIVALDNRCVAYALKLNLSLAEEDCGHAADIVQRRDHAELVAEGVQLAVVWRNFAVIQVAKRNPTCLETLDESIRLDRTDFLTHCVRAYALLTVQGITDNAAALSAAEHAFMLGHEHGPIAGWILALAQVRNGNYEASMARARHAAGDDGSAPIAAQLVMALAAAETGHKSVAEKNLTDASRRLEALDPSQEYIVTAERGMLWIDNMAFLQELKREANEALRSSRIEGP